jgi:hypothetical protein
VKNLYLEKLKRMDNEELILEVERMGKIMEQNHPLTKDEKERAMMCFRFMMQKPEVSDDNKQMLAVALRVLRIL